MRMALLTACNFLLIGFVIFLLSTDNTKNSDIAHVLIIPVTLINYFIIISYILGVYSTDESNEILVAMNTCMAFCGLCAAVY